MKKEYKHKTVLLDEAVDFLVNIPSGVYVDATCGSGGHAEKILEKTKEAGLICVDADPMMLELAQDRLQVFGDRCIFVNSSYTRLKEILLESGVKKINGILFDLGVSTEHFLNAKRGFSFMNDGPLDMRIDPRVEITACDIVNGWSKEDIADTLYLYGEERRSRKIADFIFEERKKKKIETTHQLASVVVRAAGSGGGRMHPATKTFQALRIAVNGELDNLKNVLPMSLDVLKKGARICVIAFHSLEDRIVKNFFRDNKNSALKIITKKPVIPAFPERKTNPRSRSAKLRVAERL